MSLSFASLRLSEETLDAVHALGFKMMTPVQAATIPLFLRNKDVAVEAVTGSGKTLAFVVPLVEMILRRETSLKRNQIGAIIVTSSRELAMQIFRVVSHFSQHVEGIRPLLLVGGTSIGDVLDTFKSEGASVLIGTPGRLEDMIKRNDVFDTRELEVLVLDEADTLLDLGFRATLDGIFSLLPKQRRTGLFSATQTKQVKDLARAGLRNPATVSVAVRSAATNQVQATPSTLDNFYMFCRAEDKLGLLVQFLQHQKGAKVIAFLATCASVDFFSKVLSQLSAIRRAGVPVLALHGRMVQKKRAAVYDKFLELPAGLLVCTDVAARGVDIPDVDWIVQYDPPTDPALFVHRVGRTARAGRKGRSLTLLLPPEDAYIEFLALRKVPLQQIGAMDAVALFGTAAASRLGEDGEDAAAAAAAAAATASEAANADDVADVGATAAAAEDDIDYMAAAGEEGEEEENEEGEEREEETAGDETGDGDNAAESDLDGGSAGDGSAAEDNNEAVDRAKGGKGREVSAKAAGAASATAAAAAEEGENDSKSKGEEQLWDPYPEVKRMVRADRDLLEKGTRAFVSFVRDYKAHHCQFIFRFPRLDLSAVARSFVLLRLPKMPELKGITGFEEDETDVRDIGFKDKAREKARQKRIEANREEKQQREAAEAAAGGSEMGRSAAKAKAAGAPRPVLASAARAAAEEERLRHKKRGRHQQIVDEWNELANEERLYKKLRNKRITEEEYEAELRGQAVGSDDDMEGGGASSDEEDTARKGKGAPKGNHRRHSGGGGGGGRHGGARGRGRFGGGGGASGGRFGKGGRGGGGRGGGGSGTRGRGKRDAPRGRSGKARK